MDLTDLDFWAGAGIGAVLTIAFVALRARIGVVAGRRTVRSMHALDYYAVPSVDAAAALGYAPPHAPPLEGESEQAVYEADEQAVYEAQSDSAYGETAYEAIAYEAQSSVAQAHSAYEAQAHEAQHTNEPIGPTAHEPIARAIAQERQRRKT